MEDTKLRVGDWIVRHADFPAGSITRGVAYPIAGMNDITPYIINNDGGRFHLLDMYRHRWVKVTAPGDVSNEAYVHLLNS